MEVRESTWASLATGSAEGDEPGRGGGRVGWFTLRILQQS